MDQQQLESISEQIEREKKERSRQSDELMKFIRSQNAKIVESQKILMNYREQMDSVDSSRKDNGKKQILQKIRTMNNNLKRVEDQMERQKVKFNQEIQMKDQMNENLNKQLSQKENKIKILQAQYSSQIDKIKSETENKESQQSQLLDMINEKDQQIQELSDRVQEEQINGSDREKTIEHQQLEIQSLKRTLETKDNESQDQIIRIQQTERVLNQLNEMYNNYMPRMQMYEQLMNEDMLQSQSNLQDIIQTNSEQETRILELMQQQS